MAELSAIYARALFDLAIEGGATEVYLEHAALMRQVLSDGDCQRVLVHPHIATAQKHRFFTDAFAGRVHEDLLAFLRLVIDKNREAFLLPALSELIDAIDRYQGNTSASVMTAVELREEQIRALEELLSRKLSKNVRVLPKVDPSVVGGLYIHVDGYFIDRTVKGRLHDLSASMKEGCSA